VCVVFRIYVLSTAHCTVCQSGDTAVRNCKKGCRTARKKRNSINLVI
jgi:hypothetical protein